MAIRDMEKEGWVGPIYVLLFFRAPLPQDHPCDRKTKGPMTPAVRVYVAALEIVFRQQGVDVGSTNHTLT